MFTRKRLADRSYNADVKFNESLGKWEAQKELTVTCHFDEESEAINWSKEPIDAETPIESTDPTANTPGSVQAPINSVDTSSKNTKNDMSLDSTTESQPDLGGLDDLDVLDDLDDEDFNSELDDGLDSKEASVFPRLRRTAAQDVKIFRDYDQIFRTASLIGQRRNTTLAQLLNHTRKELGCTYAQAEEFIATYEKIGDR